MSKRIFREIGSNLGRYIALLLLTIVAVGMYVGFLSGTNSAENDYKSFLKKNNVEDGYFTLDGKLGKDIQREVEELGVTVYENYYADFEQKDASTIRILNERTQIDIPYIVKGKLPSNTNEIFLDQLYASEKGLSVNDTIKVSDKEYKISGIGTFPDYTISLETQTQMIADRATFGVACVTNEAFENFESSDITYNYAFLYNNKKMKEDEKKDKLRDIVKTLACVAPIQNYGKLDDAFDKMSEAKDIDAYCGIDNNKRVSAVTAKMESNKSMAAMFVGVVIIIIAFLYVIFTKQTIQQECSVLGTLLALGIGKGEILISYLIPPCLITLLGSVIGAMLGANVLCQLPLTSLNSYYSLPITEITINSSTIIVAIVAPLLVIAIINIFSILKCLRIKPLKLIRKDIKKEKGSKKSHFNVGSFDFRFRIRLFAQNLGAYVLLFIGIFLGGWLMMFGVGMSSSFDGYIDEQQTKAVSKYQYTVSDEYDVNSSNAEKATVGSFDYYDKAKEQSYSLTGLGVQESSTFFKNIPKLKYGETIVTKAAANKFGFKKGDVISLENAATGVAEQYKIVSISDYNMGLCAIMSQKELNNILHKDIQYFNYYFSNTELEIPADYLVSSVTIQDLVDSGNVLKNVMQTMITMFPIIAVIIYLILMYLLIKMVISQNEIGISMLKIFGFTEKEIRKMYIRTNTIVTIIVIAITLPLQYLLMVSIWPACIASIPGYVNFVMGGKEFALIAVTGLICYFIANCASLRKIRKVPMVMALKNQDM